MSDVSRRHVLKAAGVLGMAATLAGTASGQDRPSADDLVKAVKGARLFDLSFVWNEQSPVLGLNPPYAFALNRTHKMTHEIFGQAPGSRVSWASDIMSVLCLWRRGRRNHSRRLGSDGTRESRRLG